jgi:hypothetical protein
MAEHLPASFYPYGQEHGFRLIDVPSGVYEIREYDGFESLHTPDSIQWIRIEGVKSNPRRR